MPKVDINKAPLRSGSGYPMPYDQPCLGRHRQALGDAGGLSQFGAHLLTLEPGAWSSQRHCHSAEDEFVYIISGTPTFIDNEGEQLLHPGDCTAHPAGDDNAHHMINHTDKNVVYLVIGSRNPQMDNGAYPDIDLAIPANGTADRVFTRKDGTPYSEDDYRKD